MPETVQVAVSDLLLDSENARLADPQGSQLDTAVALARHQGGKLVNLAEDIVRHGLDPTVSPVIVPTDDVKKRYRVLEGNRRILALKALETPTLVAPALGTGERSRLAKLAEKFASEPIGEVSCVLFPTPDEAWHWIRLRHTGDNEGVGISQWGADEKDRFEARHGDRSPARQVLDFVDKHGTLSEKAQASNPGIITNLTRLIKTPEVRERLGIDLIQGTVYSNFPVAEVAKGLSKVVDDLRSGRVQVPQIYHAEQRREYAGSIAGADLPKAGTELNNSSRLDDLTSGATPATPPKQRRRRPAPKVRTSLIPKQCVLDIDFPRINAIYLELLDLSVEKNPNATSVLLRVFLELSVDSYMTKAVASADLKKPLADKIIAAAKDLRAEGRIDEALEKAMKKVASSSTILSPKTTTLHQYVHNYYVHPSPTDLRSQWDELEPFVTAIWATP
ncbi:MAG: ParB/Srx family N-terminal domain-containing protein [Acidimicrobiia bacterium]